MKCYVHYRLVVEIDDAEDADDAWEQATDILRGGGGDITGHSIIDAEGDTIEEAA